VNLEDKVNLIKYSILTPVLDSKAALRSTCNRLKSSTWLFLLH